MDKLLVIGVDSLAGSNLAATLADRCEVIGFGQQTLTGLCETGARGHRRRIQYTPDELSNFVAAERPQWIVYCGPTSRSRWDWCDEFDAGHEAELVAATWHAAQRCDSRLALISSDAVFNGPRLFHRETSKTVSEDPAAVAARCVESALAATDALVVRTHLFGWSPSGESWTERLWAALAENTPVDATGARYATPILASDLAELLWQAFRRGLTGVYHLGGAERTSMWQFATALAFANGTSINTSRLTSNDSSVDIATCGQTESGHETSLDSRKLQRALGSPLPLLRDGITRFVEQEANRYSDQIRATLTTIPLESSAA